MFIALMLNLNMAYAASSCLHVERHFIGRTIVAPETKCRLTEPLKLEKKHQYYPYIRGGMWIEVSYWTGRWTKYFTVESEYLRTVTNRCVFPWEVVSQSSIKDSRQSYWQNEIGNPNLDPEIMESFYLSPLTEAEAVREFKRLRRVCDSHVPQEEK